MKKRSAEAQHNSESEVSLVDSQIKFPIVDVTQLTSFFTVADVQRIQVYGDSYFSNYNQRLLLYTLKLTHFDMEQAQEALQEAYLSCIRTLNAGKSIENVTFIITIIKRRLYDKGRTVKKDSHRDKNLELLAPILRHDFVSSDDVREILLTGLLELNPIHCQVLLLRYFFEMSVADMVREINDAIKSLASSALIVEKDVVSASKLGTIMLFAAMVNKAEVEENNYFLEASARLRAGREFSYKSLESLLSRARAELEAVLLDLGYVIPNKSKYSDKNSRSSSVSNVGKTSRTKRKPISTDTAVVEPGELVLA